MYIAGSAANQHHIATYGDPSVAIGCAGTTDLTWGAGSVSGELDLGRLYHVRP